MGECHALSPVPLQIPHPLLRAPFGARHLSIPLWLPSLDRCCCGAGEPVALLGAGAFTLMGRGHRVVIEQGMACTCGSWGVGVVWCSADLGLAGAAQVLLAVGFARESRPWRV
jgi:hypothetical protein